MNIDEREIREMLKEIMALVDRIDDRLRKPEFPGSEQKPENAK